MTRRLFQAAFVPSQSRAVESTIWAFHEQLQRTRGGCRRATPRSEAPAWLCLAPPHSYRTAYPVEVGSGIESLWVRIDGATTQRRKARQRPEAKRQRRRSIGGALFWKAWY